LNYYAIQVRTLSEEKFIRLIKSKLPDEDFIIHFPKRQLNIRKNGKMRYSTLAVFPGYVFVETSDIENIINCQWDFRRTEGFFRFLKSNHNITPLANNDLEIVLHFINIAGSVAGISKVSFNEDSQIIVISGPLSGLEGKIVKVDKRKGRAKIKLNLYEDSFTIDLAFETISSLKHLKKVPA